jgi:hypothetical protein
MTGRDEATLRREIAARRRAQAFQMRREGLTTDAIASRLGVTPRSVDRMVSRELRATVAEADLAERRQLHAEALMDIWRALYGRAKQGELEAIDRFLRVEERLAELLGLHAVGADDDEVPSADLDPDDRGMAGDGLGAEPDASPAPRTSSWETVDRAP